MQSSSWNINFGGQVSLAGHSFSASNTDMSSNADFSAVITVQDAKKAMAIRYIPVQKLLQSLFVQLLLQVKEISIIYM